MICFFTFLLRLGAGLSEECFVPRLAGGLEPAASCVKNTEQQ